MRLPAPLIVPKNIASFRLQNPQFRHTLFDVLKWLLFVTPFGLFVSVEDLTDRGQVVLPSTVPLRTTGFVTSRVALTSKEASLLIRNSSGRGNSSPSTGLISKTVSIVFAPLRNLKSLHTITGPVAAPISMAIFFVARVWNRDLALTNQTVRPGQQSAVRTKDEMPRCAAIGRNGPIVVPLGPGPHSHHRQPVHVIPGALLRGGDVLNSSVH